MRHAETEYVDHKGAAELLQISIQGFRSIAAKGIFKSYRVDLPHAKRGYLKDEILAYKEYRTDGKTTKIHTNHLAIRALAMASRAEQVLNRIYGRLGFSFLVLAEEREAVMRLYCEMTEFLETTEVSEKDEEVADQLLAINEGYLELVYQYTGDVEPWGLFMTVGKLLACRHNPGAPGRAMIDYAMRNIRNSAFAYICAARGVKQAKKMFREDTFTARLAQSTFCNR
jgi:hypothetical protein